MIKKHEPNLKLQLEDAKNAILFYEEVIKLQNEMIRRYKQLDDFKKDSKSYKELQKRIKCFEEELGMLYAG